MDTRTVDTLPLICDYRGHTSAQTWFQPFEIMKRRGGGGNNIRDGPWDKLMQRFYQHQSNERTRQQQQQQNQQAQQNNVAATNR